MTFRTFLTLCASSGALLAGCVGYRTPLDQGDVSDAGITLTGAGGGVGATKNDASASLPPLRAYTPDEIQTALAQCDLPHGSVVSFATFADERVFMVGAWISCPPSTGTVFSPAIVFATDGTWNHLLPDGNGGLVPGYGVQNQGNYNFPFPDNQKTNGNPYVTVAAASFDFQPAQFGDGPMTFETSPTRMHAIITYMDQTIEVWLVRLS